MKFVLWLQKKCDKKFFAPLCCSCFWIRDPGWVKIRIRDKHPGSATLRHIIGILSLQGMSYDERHHQPLGGEKPCRSCTDFKSWMRSGPAAGARKEETSPPSDSGESGTAQQPQLEEKPVDQAVLDHKAGVCPPDRSGLGSATWTFLHSVAAYFPAKPR